MITLPGGLAKPKAVVAFDRGEWLWKPGVRIDSFAPTTFVLVHTSVFLRVQFAPARSHDALLSFRRKEAGPIRSGDNKK